MEILLGNDALPTLVSRLSIERGYIYVDIGTFNNIPCTIEDYTNAILEAEGYMPGVGGDEWRVVRQFVDEVFERYYIVD